MWQHPRTHCYSVISIAQATGVPQTWRAKLDQPRHTTSLHHFPLTAGYVWAPNPTPDLRIRAAVSTGSAHKTQRSETPRPLRLARALRQGGCNLCPHAFPGAPTARLTSDSPAATSVQARSCRAATLFGHCHAPSHITPDARAPLARAHRPRTPSHTTTQNATKTQRARAARASSQRSPMHTYATDARLQSISPAQMG